MSVQSRLKDWLRNMGYDNQIPESLNKICNPSTSCIWEQIISNIKPRQEVANIRKNIMINRLKKKSLDQQLDFNYPIKEMQMYLKRKELEKRVKILENDVEEKEALIDDLLNKNKMTYVAIDNIKQKIKENREKTYLLEKNSKLIEEDIHNAQEMLTLAHNLTPIEMEENSNENNISETLEKCAQKLQKLTENITCSNSVSNTSHVKSFSNSAMKIPRTPKSSSKNSYFYKYINNSKMLTDTRAVKSTKKMNKENIAQQNHFLNVPNVKMSARRKSDKKTPKRESLGLLSDSCLDISNEFDDVFLITPMNNESSNQTISEHSKNNSLLNESSINTSPNCDIFKKLCNDKSVKETLKNLLYNNSRPLILRNVLHIYQNLLSEIRSATLECNKVAKVNKMIDENDLCELYYIHIKSELQKDKHRITVKQLQEIVKKRKEEIFSVLCIRSRNSMDEIRRIFELQIEETESTAANNFLQNEIKSSKKTEINNELQMISKKTKKVKDEIASKIDCIQILVENIHKILETIKNNREETSLCIKKLSPCIIDLSWAKILTENLTSTEIETFENFPIEYNRRFRYIDSKLFYRNVSSSTVSSSVDLDSNNLQMVTTLMDTPFSSPESILLNVFQSKLKLHVLKSLKPNSIDLNHQKYVLEELQQREEYMEDVINKFNSIINSSSVKKILSSPDYMKEVADLWIEMPLRNYISDKRLIEGHNYKFYEKVFDSSFSNV